MTEDTKQLSDLERVVLVLWRAHVSQVWDSILSEEDLSRVVEVVQSLRVRELEGYEDR